MLFISLSAALVMIVGCLLAYISVLRDKLKQAQETYDQMATELRRLDYEFGEFIYEYPNPRRR